MPFFTSGFSMQWPRYAIKAHFSKSEKNSPAYLPSRRLRRIVGSQRGDRGRAIRIRRHQRSSEKKNVNK